MGDSHQPRNLNLWCKQEVCDGFSDFTTVGFRRGRVTASALQTRNADQARRLLALASIYNGGSRADSARLASVTVMAILSGESF